MKVRRSTKSRKSSDSVRRSARTKSKLTRKLTEKAVAVGSVKDRMLSVITRGRGEKLGVALARVGLSTTLYYYYLRRATFGKDGQKRESKTSLSAADAKCLGMLIRRQNKLQVALTNLMSKTL